MIIRSAKIEDAAGISRLMGQLGYCVTSSLIEKKLHNFSRCSGDHVYVAELSSEIVGCISCHITNLFHQEGSSGRITSLVVDETCRRTGIGKSLVEKAEQFFKAEGCSKAEVTSGSHRLEAHVFYRSCGFREDEPRFIKKYC